MPYKNDLKKKITEGNIKNDMTLAEYLATNQDYDGNYGRTSDFPFCVLSVMNAYFAEILVCKMLKLPSLLELNLTTHGYGHFPQFLALIETYDASEQITIETKLYRRKFFFSKSKSMHDSEDDEKYLKTKDDIFDVFDILDHVGSDAEMQKTLKCLVDVPHYFSHTPTCLLQEAINENDYFAYHCTLAICAGILHLVKPKK